MNMKRKWKFYIKLYPLLMFVVIAFMSMGYALVDGTSLAISGSGIALMQEGIFMVETSYLDDSGAILEESRINSAEGTVLNSTIKLSETDINSYITYRITLYNNYSYDCFFEEAIFDSNFYDNENITFELNNNLLSGMKLKSKQYVTFDLTFKYVSEVTPSKEISILNSYINFNFDSIAILKSTTSTDTTTFRSSTYKTSIKNITFENKINIPSDAIESWDIGVSRTKDVMAYVVKNESDENYYDLYIQSDTQLYANENMAHWFDGFTLVDKINNLKLLDTSNTTNMSNMFRSLGELSSILTLDVSSFNTSNVVNMANLFYKTGYKSKMLELDVSKFNTSKVTNMSYMFYYTGYSSPVFTLDVSKFDTSQVTTMGYAFSYTGYANTSFTLDVSNFNTSNVTFMKDMFWYAGYNSTEFTLNVKGFDISKVTSTNSMFGGAGYNSTVFELDLSNFNTSNVTDMAFMFYKTGYSNPDFTLDVSNFDTSNVKNMAQMFRETGYKSASFKLNLGNFNTSNVTDMTNMFYNTGYNSTVLELDVSSFNTSNVTNMNSMFAGAGYKSTLLNLDVSKFNTSKVTDMSSMFNGAGRSSTVFSLNVNNFDTSKVTDMNGMFKDAGYSNQSFTLDVSNFDTSQVTNMNSMFYGTGALSTIFTLDVSNFDTSKVTDMSHMFRDMGYYSQKLTLDLSNFDTSQVTDMSYMFRSTGDRCTVFNLNISNFDTSKVTNMSNMFYSMANYSTVLNASITISNPNTTSYSDVFNDVATLDGTRFIVYYTDETSELVDKMVATKSSSSYVFKAPSHVDENNIKIGDVLSLAGDKFNVIEVLDNEVMLLAQYNLGSNYRQSTSAYNRTFADSKNWSAVDDNMEIDIQEYSGNPKLLVNGYVNLLKHISGNENITGDLITLSKLKELECTIEDYGTTSSDFTCANSKYASWLVNGQYWWTKSMFPANQTRIWLVYNDGTLNPIGYTDSRGIRPVITVPIDVFK